MFCLFSFLLQTFWICQLPYAGGVLSCCHLFQTVMFQRQSHFCFFWVVAMANATVAISFPTALHAPATATSDGLVGLCRDINNYNSIIIYIYNSNIFLFLFCRICISPLIGSSITSSIHRCRLLRAILPTLPFWSSWRLRFRQSDRRHQGRPFRRRIASFG